MDTGRNNPRETISEMLDKARSQGATSGDAVWVESESSEVQVRMGQVDKLSSARENRLGLRLFFGRRAAVTSTADFSRNSLMDLVSTTCKMAKAASEDPFAGLPDEDVPNPSADQDLDLYDPDLMKAPMEDRIGLTRRAEAAALEEDPRITNSEGGHLALQTRRIHYMNSRGLSPEYAASSVSLSVVPIASENGTMQRDYWYSAKRKRSLLDSPESIGRSAAQRTIRRLGGRKVATLSCPVVLDPESAGDLLGSLSAAVSGYSVYKGASFLKGMLGKTVASGAVTVIDDGTLPSALGSRPFDGEGLPTRKTVVVRNGILESYLLDTYSSRKLGLASTGNAARGIGDFPSVSPTNFYLAPGDTTPEAIIASVKNGLYVTEMIGFGVNLVTGDYSRGATGVWIENGRLTHPVEGVTIAGNLKNMLLQIEAVGSDLELRSSVASPTLLISKMMVAGD